MAPTAKSGPAPPAEPEDLAQASDERLIELALDRGDRDDRPFAELFRRHHNNVWRLCYRYLKDPQDAEDLTQEVFFRAYRALHAFEGKAAFKTWLYRIAANACLNELRRRQRQPVLAQPTFEDMEPALPATLGVEAEALSQTTLREAWRRLAPHEREVLYLREVEDCSYEEIAARLGIGLSAAKMRVQRARRALQAAFRHVERDEANP